MSSMDRRFGADVRWAVAAGNGQAGEQSMTELNLRGVLGIEGAAPAALACLPASRPPPFISARITVLALFFLPPQL